MKNLKAIKRIYEQITCILTSKQKQGSIIVFISMIICACLELLGVSAIYPFLQSMLTPELIRDKWYVKWIYFINPRTTVTGCLVTLGVCVALVFIIKNVVALICTRIQLKYAARMQKEISTLMLKSYMQRPYQYFVNTNSSVIFRGLAGDTGSVYQTILCLFQIMTEILTACMLGIYLLIADWFIAICALILAFICMLVIIVGFKGRMKRTGQQARAMATEQTRCSQQAVFGIKEITVLDRRQTFIDRYYDVAAKVEKLDVTSNFINACPDRILEGVCIGGFMLIICIRILMKSDISAFVPVLGTFAMAAFKILPSISKISTRVNNLIYYQPGTNNCYNNIMEARRLDAEYDAFKKGSNIDESIDEKEIKFTNELSINNITWKYETAADPVLKDLSLNIKKGEAVAFIGSSGAGKTTLADVILGLFKPQKGTIELDGVDISLIPHTWAKTIGYVPQSLYLLDESIRENVAFGVPTELIDDNKIWAALEQAQLADFVRSMPEGLDTKVGEYGAKISGGQRQRIAIARALYENPDILVLDEATSALDTETETAVMESIDALQGTKTLIIVAHRLTTIRNCDRIYEIGNGVARERNKEEVLA